MPVSTRVSAVLHYVDGLTLEEVAAEVDLSVSEVRKRLRGLQERRHIEGLEEARAVSRHARSELHARRKRTASISVRLLSSGRDPTRVELVCELRHNVEPTGKSGPLGCYGKGLLDVSGLAKRSAKPARNEGRSGLIFTLSGRR
jgi:hypothetical protein